ncbi:MAG: hypothetical protein CMP06_09620 [Xanthomonadales bacterium]|nr:hypothetical protein [Xanthomonadales bacterium]
MTGEFQLDDYPNIVQQSALRAERITPNSFRRAIQEGSTNQLGRPIAILTFMVDYAAAGLDPKQFLRTNLLIHLATTLTALLFVFRVAQLTGIRRAWAIALFATLLWAAHPINLTAVLYIVQRMTSLAALFVLAAAALYAGFRTIPRPSALRTGTTIAAIGILMISGALSKENAVLAPMLLVSVELLARWTRSDCGTKLQRLAFWLCAGIPSLLVASFLIWKIPDFAASYQHREFNLGERVLTEARVIWLYIAQILYPRISEMSLYHDSFPLSRGLWSPPSTAASVLGLAVTTGLVILLRRRLPWLCFGIVFFFTGHLLESTIVPLELVFEHRNYLPSVGLIGGLSLQVGAWTQDQHVSMRRIVVMASAALGLVLILQTHLRASIWGEPIEHVEFALRTNPESARVQNSAANLYHQLCDGPVASNPTSKAAWCDQAIAHYRTAASIDADNAGSLIRAAALIRKAGRAVPEGMLFEIDQRLRNGASVWVNYNVLHGYLVEEDGSAHFPAHWLANWAEISARNPRTKPLARAAILSGYSQLLFNRMQRPDEALQAMEQAAKLRPDRFDIQMSLTKLYIALGDTENADRQLEYMRSMKGAWAYEQEFSKLSAKLRSTR